MADIVFNISKGAAAEKARDDATKFGVMLLKTVESDAAMKDRTTITDLLSANTEANFTNYARKTPLTATLTVDQGNDRVDISVPQQTWVAAGGVTNNTLAKLVVFYEEAAADATRIPISAHDFVATTDGNDLLTSFAAAGFYRAS